MISFCSVGMKKRGCLFALRSLRGAILRSVGCRRGRLSFCLECGGDESGGEVSLLFSGGGCCRKGIAMGASFVGRGCVEKVCRGPSLFGNRVFSCSRDTCTIRVDAALGRGDSANGVLALRLDVCTGNGNNLLLTRFSGVFANFGPLDRLGGRLVTCSAPSLRRFIGGGLGGDGCNSIGGGFSGSVSE